jgi:hypothetical protein
MKPQSKSLSLFESLFQTIVGLFISIVIQLILYPMLKIEVSFNQNLVITFVFFLASIIRGYFIRRFFNKIK